MYSYYYYNMIYFKLCFNSIKLQCNTFSSHERHDRIKLDDYNILHRDHLVRNRPSPECMIHLVLKTSASHDSDCSSVRLMDCTTNKHLAWLDLRENLSTPSGLVTPIPHLGQGFECRIRRAHALRESASRPLVDFGVLNDNLIKGLISCVSE
jgi:hypothetical protein